MNKPNILFILIDDMGWKDLTCYGSSFYETPHLDQLAQEGMQFTDAYAACPVCSPTRASILTGKFPATLGVTDYIGGHARGKVIDAPYIDHLPLEEKTIAAALKENGYRTYSVGKWHLGSEPFWPEHHGFDVNIGGCGWGHPQGGYFSPWGNPRLENGPEGEYLTDRITDEAVRLLQDNGNTPFFMYLSHFAVHTPIQAPRDLIEKYQKKSKELGLDTKKTFEENGPFPCDHKKHKNIIRRLLQSDPAYAAMVENLDSNIGRVLSALDELGMRDNTIVVFTSDNGGLATAEGSPTCNSPLSEGKGWMYEGGTREPLIIRWPGVIEPGSECKVPVTSPDFYPTFLEAAGLTSMPEQHCDGETLMPLLKGNDSLEREAIFWHYPHYGNQGGTPGSSVRAGDYKLIEFFEDGRLELYNLRDDISEKHNLAQEKPDLVKKLHAMLIEWREKVEAKIPEPNPEFI